MSAGISMAQITIKGKVTGKKDGKPLAGAIVQAKEGNTDLKTTTDAQGNFSITVSSEVKNLVFSFNGFNSQTIGIGNKTVINVALNTPGAGMKKNMKPAKAKNTTNKSIGK